MKGGTKMNYIQAKKILAQNGQEHLLAFWERLGAAERKSLLAQIAAIDFKELARCKSLLPAAAPAPCLHQGQGEKRGKQAAHRRRDEAVNLIVLDLRAIQVFQVKEVIVFFVGSERLIDELVLLRLGHASDIRMNLQPGFQDGFFQGRIKLSKQLLPGDL